MESPYPRSLWTRGRRLCTVGHVHIDTVMALASLGMAVWEARRVRRGERHARALFVLFLACAAGFTAFAVHGWFNGPIR